MELKLTPQEIRVLGVLLEKEMQTPDYYPLTLNALVNACNQKSSREPVMQLEEPDVEKAINGLKRHQLAWRMDSAYGRVSKYEHNVIVKWKLERNEMAALCVILLRGAQTVGEIKGRTKRMVDFNSLDEVGRALKKLSDNDSGALVSQLPREPGRKENRFDITFRAENAELVSGAGVANLSTPPPDFTQKPIAPRQPELSQNKSDPVGLANEQENRILALEERLDALEDTVQEATDLLEKIAGELGIQ